MNCAICKEFTEPEKERAVEVKSIVYAYVYFTCGKRQCMIDAVKRGDLKVTGFRKAGTLR